MGKGNEIRHNIGAGGTLQLRGVSGSVRLSGADGDEVVIVARSGRGGMPELTVERGAGHLLVEPPRAGLSFIRRDAADIDFEVTVPRRAKVDVRSVSADVTGSGLEGEQDYKSVSGDLYLAGGAGRVTAQTVSGDIRLDGARRVELSATTTSGDVALDAQLVDLLRVRTVSGDVRLTGKLADGPRHSVETVSGDLILRSTGGVTVEPSRALDIGRSGRRPIVIGDGRAQLSFRSMSGEERVSGQVESSPPSAAPAEEPPTRTHPLAEAPAPPAPPEPPAPPAPPATRLEVLRALERGDIDVDEATRRLDEVSIDA